MLCCSQTKERLVFNVKSYYNKPNSKNAPPNIQEGEEDSNCFQVTDREPGGLQMVEGNPNDLQIVDVVSDCLQVTSNEPDGLKVAKECSDDLQIVQVSPDYLQVAGEEPCYSNVTKKGRENLQMAGEKGGELRLVEDLSGRGLQVVEDGCGNLQVIDLGWQRSKTCL